MAFKQDMLRSDTVPPTSPIDPDAAPRHHDELAVTFTLDPSTETSTLAAHCVSIGI